MKNLSVYLSLILLPISIGAQNELTGNVKDAKDSSAIVGATIYIQDMKTGAASGIDGSYSIKNLPKGNFLVEVRMSGYTPIIREVEINGVTTVNFRMSVSSIEFQEVVITGLSSSTERQTDPVPVNIVSQNDFLQNSS
ncbi:MAG TPA: carboxypeptidase-like regulatory domain-containing protein, partial [Bacteroidia bacterium]|nr:carboxypeptidase-like regulatory domain-containing protein [Bacteroidia bacterium]